MAAYLYAALARIKWSYAAVTQTGTHVTKYLVVATNLVERSKIGLETENATYLLVISGQQSLCPLVINLLLVISCTQLWTCGVISFTFHC